MVLHLYDPDSTLGASLDLLLEAKAGSYMGTRLVSILGRRRRSLVACVALLDAMVDGCLLANGGRVEFFSFSS